MAVAANELDALADKIAARLSPAKFETITMGQLFSQYFSRHVEQRCKASEKSNAHYFWKAHGERWQHVQVHEIKRADVQLWCDEIASRAPSSAERAVNVLAAIINWGIRRELLPAMENPCRYVDKPKTQARERFLCPVEIREFAEVLNSEPPLMRDFFWLALLTGARKSNLMSMEWSEIDFDLKTWTIPAVKYKNGSTQTLPLIEPALEVLKRRRSVLSGKWVFPGRGGQPVKDVRKAWGRIRSALGLDDIRVHDLRRTLGSYLAMNGASPYLIARMLGHKDTRSTAVYARLDLRSVRKAAEEVGQGWMEILAIEAQTSQPVSQQPQAVALLESRHHSLPEQSAAESKIVAALRPGLRLNKTALHRALSNTMKSEELDRILSELLQRKVLRCVQDDRGRKYYELVRNPVALSPRQKQVLQGIAQKKTNRQIASDLGVSLSAVNLYVKNTFSRLGVNSRQDAAQIAIREGVISQ